MPQPKNIAYGSLDMSLRQLLTHMLEHHLDHTVLVMAEANVRIAVTIGKPEQIERITRMVQQVLTP